MCHPRLLDHLLLAAEVLEPLLLLSSLEVNQIHPRMEPSPVMIRPRKGPSPVMMLVMRSLHLLALRAGARFHAPALVVCSFSLA